MRSTYLCRHPSPHFTGTFDSFLWQFLVVPFGVDGTDKPARLIPDKNSRTSTPFRNARSIRLKVFDRNTGKIIDRLGRELRFNPSEAQALAYVTAAIRSRGSAIECGELDLEDALNIALSRCNDAAVSARLRPPLAGRFRDVIVDEAQDRNTADLDIIKWLHPVPVGRFELAIDYDPNWVVTVSPFHSIQLDTCARVSTRKRYFRPTVPTPVDLPGRRDFP